MFAQKIHLMKISTVNLERYFCYEFLFDNIEVKLNRIILE